MVHFAAPPIPTGQVRDWIVLSNGVYTVALSGAQAGEGESQALPMQFALRQNQPNPFTGTTTFRFELPRAEHVRLELFDLQGRLIERIADRRYEAGRWSVEWDPRHGRGAPVPAGIYLYRLRAGAFSDQRKMIVLD